MTKSKIMTPLVVVTAAWLIAGPPPMWISATLVAIIALVATSMLADLMRR
jgi:hypothetical protein